jgi:NIPSNAP
MRAADTLAEGMAVIHEMRVYEAMPGRLGDLNKRFREITLPIWARLGIRPVAFWTTLVGPSNNTLFYILSWDSMAERERIWTSFMTDEEWLRRKGEMDRDGVLVARAENQLLQLTDYSPRVS